MDLLYIGNADQYKICGFYENFLANVDTPDTMGKLREIKGYGKFALDKLDGKITNLVQMNDNWQNWDFPEFIEALDRMERNPITVIEINNTSRKAGCSKHSKSNGKHMHVSLCADAAERQKFKDLP